uniref:Tetraspanin n=1 Tax=Heliothis virescens TaxID=7102 RepID=A0A2A4JFK4_HELVI
MSTPAIQDIHIQIGFPNMKSRRIRCMKFFITLFNIICILFGLILMAICVINIRDKKSQQEQQSAVSRGVLSFILTTGVALVVTAVLGCVGALREHVRLLYVHAGFFIFLVAVELVVGVGGAVLSAWVGGSSELRVQFYRNTTVEDETARYHTFWDDLQSNYQCCGVDGPQDYAIIHRDIPASCCARAHPLREGGARRHLHANCITDRTYYMRGCEEALRQKKAFKGNIFISTGIIFTLVEILCIVLALWMARTVRSERRKLQANLQAHFES